MSGSIVMLVVLALYMAPTFVAVWLNKKHSPAICALNVFTAWTGMGWVAALVWALADADMPRREER